MRELVRNKQARQRPEARDRTSCDMKTDCLSGGDQPFVIETSRRKALLSTVVEIRAHMQSHEKRLQQLVELVTPQQKPGSSRATTSRRTEPANVERIRRSAADELAARHRRTTRRTVRQS